MSSILKRRSAAKSSLKSSNGSSTRVDCQPDERDTIFTPGRSGAFLRPQRPQSAGSGEGGRVSSWSQIYSRVDPGEFVTSTMNDRRRSLSGVVFTPPFSALRRFSRVSTSTGSGGGGGPADPGMGVGGIDRSSSPSPPTQQHQPPQPTRLHTVPFAGQEDMGHHDAPAHDHDSNGTPQIDGEPTTDGLGFRYNATPSPPMLSARQGQGQQQSPHHQEAPVVPLMSAPMAVSHHSYVFSVTPPTFDRRNETYHRDAEYRKVAKKEGKLQSQALGQNHENRAALAPGRHYEGHILQPVLIAILVVILSAVTQQALMAPGPSAATPIATTPRETTTTETLASRIAKCASYASLASLTFAGFLAAMVMAMGAMTTTTTQLGRRGSSLANGNADGQMQQQLPRRSDEDGPTLKENRLLRLCGYLVAQGAFLQLISLLAQAINVGGASGKVVVLCLAGCFFASFGSLHRKADGTPAEARPSDQLWHPTPHRATGVEQQQQQQRRPGFTRGSTWSHPHRGGGEGGDWNGMAGGDRDGGGAGGVPNHLRPP